jgi:hypothetical protein
MSLYRKYAQGDAVKTNFNLTLANIDEYIFMSNSMNDELKLVKSLLNLYKKRENNSPDYSQEYINTRINALESKIANMDEMQSQIKIEQELIFLDSEIDKVRPLVFDKEEGKKQEHHERMTSLTERYSVVEEEKNNIYGVKYVKLKANLPKIYYMILEGVDINTVNSCFANMKKVLSGAITSEDAADKLMDESTRKYNLPKTLYDPIRVVKK